MRKIVLVATLVFVTFAANAQIDKVLMEQRKKDKSANDAAILDAKKSAKAQLWYDRGVLYDEIARLYTEMDSSASIVAYDAFKKSAEMDVKDGKPGAIAKKAQAALTGAAEGVNLYGALVKQGAEKFQNKNYINALKYFDLAQIVSPKDTLAPMYAGYSGLQAQKNDIAAPQMEKYISNGGKDASNFALLAQVYRLEKSYDKALAILDKGVATLPNSAVSFKAERVNVLLDAARTEDAKATLRELTVLDPKNSQYPTNYGILHDNEATNIGLELKKLKEAGSGIVKLKKVVENEKLKAQDLVGEQKRISDLIKKQPKNADLKRQLADVQKLQVEGKKTLDAAIAEVAKAEEAAKALGNVDVKIAEMSKKVADYKAIAVEYYQKALVADPKNFDPLFNLGVFYFNDAVEMKKVVDDMEIKDYQTRGKEIESKVCGKFKQALPYFTRAKAVRDDESASENIKMIDTLLKQFEEKKVICEETK